MRARRGSVLGRDEPGARPCSWERSEVGNLNAWVGGKCCACQLLLGVAPSSLPPSPFPFSPSSSFPSSSLLHPCPASLLTPRPSALPSSRGHSQAGDKTRPPAVTCGPQSGPKVRLGHCRRPGAHSAAARLIPAHLTAPAAAAPFMGPQAEAVPRRPQPALAAALSMCAIHTAGPPLGPRERAAASRPSASTGPG